MTILYFILGYFVFGLIYTAITLRPLARASIYAAMKLDEKPFMRLRDPEIYEIIAGWIVAIVVSIFKIPFFPIFFFVDPFIWKKSREVKQLIKATKFLDSL